MLGERTPLLVGQPRACQEWTLDWSGTKSRILTYLEVYIFVGRLGPGGDDPQAGPIHIPRPRAAAGCWFRNIFVRIVLIIFKIMIGGAVLILIVPDTTRTRYEYEYEYCTVPLSADREITKY